MARKNEKIQMFCHNTSQASNNKQLGNVTAADEGCFQVGMKGTMLYKSNVIQKYSGGERRGDLTVGRSMAFAILAQKRVEFGNGTRRRRIRMFLEEEHGGVQRGLDGSKGPCIPRPGEVLGSAGEQRPTPALSRD